MRYLFLIGTTIVLLNYSCSDKGTNPEDEPDTTSHAFTWEIFEFPTEQIQSNIFWDIFAESDSNVWAVGQVYVDSLDSSGSYIEPYNAAHWDGNKWNLKRFTYNQGIVVKPIRSIWYFSDNNIWFGAGSIFHFDGIRTSLIHRPDLGNSESIEHLWAMSENEIYAVGTKGLIMRYNGTSWSKMQSGTTMDFQDIWGTVDEKTGNVEVWTVGYDESEKIGIILKYNSMSWETMFDKDNQIYVPDDDHTAPTAVWGINDSIYFALAGYDSSRIVRHDRNNFLSFYSPHTEDQGSIQSFHGIDYNDYFAVGYRDVVLHYNGFTFKKYFDWIYLDGRYHGVQQIGDKVFICGNIFTSSSAILLYGKR